MDIETNRELRDRSRLEHLDEKQLVPESFSKLEFTEGKVDVIADRAPEAVRFAVVDEKPVKLSEIEDNFLFFDKNTDEGGYPGLKLNEKEYRRPLVIGSMHELSADTLVQDTVEANETLRGKGLGVAFQENVYRVAKELGYKFVAGYHHDPETAEFFLRRGLYLYEEIRDEYRDEFKQVVEDASDVSEEAVATVKFLNEEDEARMLGEGHVGRSPEQKLEYLQKFRTASEIVKGCERLLNRAVAGKQEAGDVATVIEILEDLNDALPEDAQEDFGELSEDEPETISTLRAALERIRQNKFTFLDKVDPKKLEDNLKVL